MNCSICLDDFSHGADMIIFRCKHTFHYECVMGNNGLLIRKCPYCRGRIPNYPRNNDDVDLIDSPPHPPHTQVQNFNQHLNHLIVQIQSPRGTKRPYSKTGHDNYPPAKRIKLTPPVLQNNSLW